MAGSRGGSEGHALEDAPPLLASPGGTWEGGLPPGPSGDTTPAPLPGLSCSTGPAGPLPSEK